MQQLIQREERFAAFSCRQKQLTARPYGRWRHFLIVEDGKPTALLRRQFEYVSIGKAERYYKTPRMFSSIFWRLLFEFSDARNRNVGIHFCEF